METTALFNALKVFTRDPKIVRWLQINDPKALAQACAALGQPVPKMKTHRRKLGEVQKEALQSLRTHGSWKPNCGWVWNTTRGTIRIMLEMIDDELHHDIRRDRSA